MGTINTPLAGSPADQPTVTDARRIGGFAPLWRSLRNHEGYRRARHSWRSVLNEILMSAAWQQSKWFDGRKSIDILPGMLITSYEHLAHNADVSVQEARSAVKFFENCGFLTRTSTRHYTILTVVYSGDCGDGEAQANTPSNAPPTHQPHTANTPPTTSKQITDNKGKVKEEPTPTPTPSTVPPQPPAGPVDSSPKQAPDAGFSEAVALLESLSGKPFDSKERERALPFWGKLWASRVSEAMERIRHLCKFGPSHLGRRYSSAEHYPGLRRILEKLLVEIELPKAVPVVPKQKPRTAGFWPHVVPAEHEQALRCRFREWEEQNGYDEAMRLADAEALRLAREHERVPA